MIRRLGVRVTPGSPMSREDEVGETDTMVEVLTKRLFSELYKISDHGKVNKLAPSTNR